ncbi:MAG: T9SS type A sorting domain-containing protein [Bacteroidetes bacterium]|nr:T9SS type A sorting domain-containing protein [Bacteroidota bacterium]
MKFIYYIFLLLNLILLPYIGDAQSSLFFKGHYSRTTDTIYGTSSCLDTLSRNSFLFGGASNRNTASSDTLANDSYLLKSEISGLTKWFKKYHFHSGSLSFNDIKTDKNNDVLICGSSSTLTALIPDGFLFKSDSNGIVRWARFYPKQEILSIRPLKDGDIAIFATDSSKKMKLCLLDVNGNVKWCKRQASNFNNQLYFGKITEGMNKDLLFYGFDGKAFAILLDSLGNNKKNLNMTNPNSLAKIFYSSISFFNNGYFICGVGQGVSNLFTGHLLRLDNSLNILWYKNLITANSYSEFFDITAFNNNSLVLLNEPESYGNTSADLKRMGLTFIDSIGNVRKNILFTSDSVNHLPSKFFLLNDGNILFHGIGYTDTITPGMNGCYGITDTLSNGFCGFTPISYINANTSQNFTFNNYSFLNGSLASSTIILNIYVPISNNIEYICSSGPFGPYDPIDLGFEENEIKNSLILFPNPANESVMLINNEYENRFLFFTSKVRITNVFGISVFETEIRQNTSLTVNTKEFKEGMYILSIFLTNGETIVKKFIIKH